MKDSVEKAQETIGEVLFDGISQAPFAALLFGSDDNLTIIWRNDAHARMSDSVGREVQGRPLFEAFPPSEDTAGAEAKDAIFACVERLRSSGASEDIGPYRFDLPDDSGVFVEHHWQMTMSPIVRDGDVVAVMQVAKDVTHAVFSARVDESLKRAASETASVCFFSYDPETDIFVRSEDVDAMFGFEPDEAGRYAAPFFERVDPNYLDGVYAEVARVRAASQGDTLSLDYPVLWPDGSEHFLRIRGEMTIDPVDRREKLVGTFVDLTDIEQDRRSLAQSLEIREALVAEANHRIKNSLSIASSILRMQTRPIEAADSISPDQALDVLHSVEARIRAVADVHGLIQLHQQGIAVSLRSLVERLVAFTRQSADITDREFSVTMPEGDIALDSDKAVSLGLVLNELMTNALKYGLGTKDETAIDLTVDFQDDQTVFELKNNHVETKRVGKIFSTKLGSRLVQQLASQLDANLLVEETADIYSVTLTLPA